MKVGYVSRLDPDKVLDPDAAAFRGAGRSRVRLTGTPLGLQPTASIRASWTQEQIGAVDAVQVSAIHDGQTLAFRLEWRDASENADLTDTTSFPDAAAILLPSVPKAPLMTMGAPGAAVTALYWRADDEACRHIVAEGLGTTRTVDLQHVRGRGSWKDGGWRVVITRPLRVETDEPVAQLEPGTRTGFGVAVWEGGHSERAGIKSFSGDWIELALEAPASARR